MQSDAKIRLRLILVSSKTHEFEFSVNASAAVVTQHVFDNWPADWVDEPKPERNILRLIYQGRFLHNDVILSALQLPLSRPTVMHLVPRENLPEPNSHGQNQREKSPSQRNCDCCVIL